MNISLRITYPLFSWIVFLSLGIDAIKRDLVLPMVILALGLAGVAETYWKSKLRGSIPYAKGDLIAFGIGVVPAIVYSVAVMIYLLSKYLLKQMN